ncbi:hypothetical protein FISHEDRAFT_58674 [Fistulina hepatica ATCC 64428]|uniref:Uncharacterized protein n=1 Tax=Fistulina hepatica ATCC 64428 TaxID=1128425 RepID=A0A0D7AD79_9AGAR|nr:hypothetical protein FISHEDRAFT_58674 [Fistulina hepatica ATCC 64428]
MPQATTGVRETCTPHDQKGDIEVVPSQSSAIVRKQNSPPSSTTPSIASFRLSSRDVIFEIAPHVFNDERHMARRRRRRRRRHSNDMPEGIAMHPGLPFERRRSQAVRKKPPSPLRVSVMAVVEFNVKQVTDLKDDIASTSSSDGLSNLSSAGFSDTLSNVSHCGFLKPATPPTSARDLLWRRIRTISRAVKTIVRPKRASHPVVT